MGLNISVALCTFNGEPYLAQQLDSIQKQTERPFELVACDDGSQDKTVEILRNFASMVDFPVYIHQNERNLGSTRNFEQAIGLCKGELIVLCDQDDVWMSHKLASIEAIFGAEPDVAAVFSDAALIDLAGASIGERLWARGGFTPERQRAFDGRTAVKRLIHRDTVTGATLAFRSCFVDRLLPIAPSWVHDGWITLILACVAEVRPVPDCLIQYRLHPRQQIGADKLSLTDRLFTIKERAIAFHRMTSERWAAMAQRMDSLLVDEAITSYVVRKAVFFERRAELLERPRLARMHLAAGMLIDYFRFDKGLLSFLRDIAH